ncbi:hypothetical protein JZL56_10805, partial [Staphylococcus aureus]|nr:hypothetical protein [Staphylococcus aureus]MCB8132448.1 hypothetical protein [Staphylococcus aureus]MCB8166396.1 hypothetical protein [Staphylococcus aureus]MCB8171657.1 hypothetical protein [Staphylococcus aureus]
KELINEQLKPKEKLTGRHYLELINMLKQVLKCQEVEINDFIENTYKYVLHHGLDKKERLKKTEKELLNS